jgi:hypothetical protein
MAVRPQKLWNLSYYEVDKGAYKETISALRPTDRFLQEIDLLLSPSVPSILLPALPFVLTTDDIQVLSPSALGKGQFQVSSPLTKIFLSKHVAALKDEFLSVKNFGTGAAEEWLKGLEERGKEQRVDADRWEKWETNGGLRQLWQPQLPVAKQAVEHQTKNDASGTSQAESAGLLGHDSMPPLSNVTAKPNWQAVVPLKVEGGFYLSLSTVTLLTCTPRG